MTTYRFIILFFFIVSIACVHQDRDRSAYRIDHSQNNENPKISLGGHEEEFRAKAHQEYENLIKTKKRLYGLGRIQMGCNRKETNYISAFLFGPIDASDGYVDSDSYTYCAEHRFTNWLRMNWTCPNEETSFVKTKTTQVLKKSVGNISLLSDEGVVLQMLLLSVDQNFDSMDAVPDVAYERAKRLRFDLNQDFLIIERNDLSRTILLTEKMCQRD